MFGAGKGIDECGHGENDTPRGVPPGRSQSPEKHSSFRHPVF